MVHVAVADQVTEPRAGGRGDPRSSIGTRGCEHSGLDVTANDIAAARAAGASDEDLNDTVLGAVALCMVNQYVDGSPLRPPPPPAEATFPPLRAQAQRLK